MRNILLFFLSLLITQTQGQYSPVDRISNKSNSKSFYQKDIFQTAFFLKNDKIIPGRGSERVAYFACHDHMTVYFTKTGLVYKLNSLENKKETKEEHKKEHQEEGSGTLTTSMIEVNWLNSNPDPAIIATDKGSAYYTFINQDSQAISSQQTSGFKKLLYKDVYPNIDIEFSFPEQGGIKYELVLRPGADPDQVKFSYSGDIIKMRSDKEGNITIHSHSGDLTEHAPVSYTKDKPKVGCRFKLSGHNIGFSIDQAGISGQTLIIDPWVTALTTMPPVNMGFNVDYDNAGDLFVYGAAGAYKDSAHFLNLAKYDTLGNPQWVFLGEIASLDWFGGGSSPIYNDPDYQNFTSNFYTDKFTGKSYIGEGFFYNRTAMVIRLDTNGDYDNFITSDDVDNYKFSEVSDFAYDCNGSKDSSVFGISNPLIVLGGDPEHPVSMGVLDTADHALALTNITTYTDTAAQDIARGVFDPYGNLYVVFVSMMLLEGPDNARPYSNHIYKTNQSLSYSNYVWNTPTGNFNLAETWDKPFYVPRGMFLYSGNNFNCLSANHSYLYFYDGESIKAFDYSTGSQVGNTYSIPNYRAMYQGGIAVDECNNIYAGGNGVIKAFHFDGQNFNPQQDIYLGRDFPDTGIYDVRYNPSNNLLYVSGFGIVGTYPAYLSDSCDTWNAFTISTIDKCDSAEVIVSTPNGLKASYSYTWMDTAGNIIAQILNTTDTIFATSIPGHGYYTIEVHLNHNCMQKSIYKTIWIGPDISIGPHDTAICPNQTVILRGTSGSPGGTFLWQPSGSTADTSSFTLSASEMVYLTYTLPGCGTARDSIFISVQSTPVLTVNDPDICIGGSVLITAVPSVPGGTYLWSPGGDSTQSIMVSPTVDSSYIVAYSVYGCSTVTDTAFVTVHALPAFVSITTTTSKCFNPNGTAFGIASGGSAPYQYEWTYGVETNPDTGLFAGFYSGTVTDANGCQATDTFSIYDQKITDSFMIGTDTVSCFGSPIADGMMRIIALDTSDGPFVYSLNGQSMNDSAVFGGLIAGSYQVSVTNRWDCDTILSINIPQPEAARLVVMPADTTIQENDSVQLSSLFTGYPPGSINTYSWQPVTGLSCSTCPDPTANTYDTINIYTLTVSYNKGCLVSASDTIKVEIIPCADQPIHLYPNPNDGSFSLDAPEAVGSTYVIYDMLGQLAAQDVITDRSMPLSMAGAASGVYIMIVHTPCGNRKIVFTVVK